MRMFCTAVVSLSMALTTALAAPAQDIAASSDEVARCASWVKATVPADVRLNGSDFCAGVNREGDSFGWFSSRNCGEQPKGDKAAVSLFCASSGQIGPDWTIVAGYNASGPDGSQFNSGTREGRASSVTLYSRTPWHVGDTRIPAGFSQLTLSHTDRGWWMTVVPDREKFARTVLLAGTRQLGATGKELAIEIHYGVRRCSDALHMELSFSLGDTDLYVCMLPDHIPPMSDESAAGR